MHSDHATGILIVGTSAQLGKAVHMSISSVFARRVVRTLSVAAILLALTFVGAQWGTVHADTVVNPCATTQLATVVSTTVVYYAPNTASVAIIPLLNVAASISAGQTYFLCTAPGTPAGWQIFTTVYGTYYVPAGTLK